jgi:hypothetical protein
MKRIVFVTGAGSSVPYGYPTGNKLIEMILDSLNPRYLYLFKIKYRDHFEEELKQQEITQSFSDYKIFQEYGFKPDFIESFRIALLNSKRDSIDSFLLNRQEFYEIGKLAIANCILKCENPSELQYANQDWLKYVWNRTEPDPINPFTERIAFITFNYDRVIEAYLYNTLKFSFNFSDKKIAGLINDDSVIHLHGKVGDLNWQNTKDGFDYNYPVGNFEASYLRTVEASKRIDIIYDKKNWEPVYQKAQERLDSADNIYLLGFGYHYLNIKRLRLDILREPVHGSSYGLTKHECTLIRNKYNSIWLDREDHNYNNLEFIRNTVVFE